MKMEMPAIEGISWLPNAFGERKGARWEIAQLPPSAIRKRIAALRQAWSMLEASSYEELRSRSRSSIHAFASCILKAILSPTKSPAPYQPTLSAKLNTDVKIIHRLQHHCVIWRQIAGKRS